MDPGERRVIGYAAAEIFSAEEVRACELARTLVERLPDRPDLRCHEVARIVRALLGWGQVEDGRYHPGGDGLPIEHSWIELHKTWRHHHVLDVYAVGRVPMVQLVDCGFPLASPFVGGAVRGDVRVQLVEEMVALLSAGRAGPGGARPGRDSAAARRGRPRRPALQPG